MQIGSLGSVSLSKTNHFALENALRVRPPVVFIRSLQGGAVDGPLWMSPSTRELNRLMETIANLMYLIAHDSHDSTKVCFYIELAEKALERMRAIIHEEPEKWSAN